MEIALSILAGLLVSAGVYLFLRRHLLQLFFGFILLSNATILLIFTMGRLDGPVPPLVEGGGIEAAANPLSQALILTSIVIGFGLQAFLLVLIYRSEKALGTVDLKKMRIAEHEEEGDESYPRSGNQTASDA